MAQAPVLVLEDDENIRRTYRNVLRSAGYAVSEAASLAEARNLLRTQRDFHCAVVDYNLPDGSVTELLAELIEARPLCRSLVITGMAEERIANETARAGAHAYLRKPLSPPELLHGVSRTVQSTLEWREALSLAGQPDFSERAKSQTVPGVTFDMRRAVTRLRILGRLTPASTVIAWRMLWGDSNRRIAELVGCSERTVKFHITDILARTGARSRADLLRVLLEDAGVRDPWGNRGSIDRPDRGGKS